MHTLSTAQPCPALRPFVRAYAQRQTSAADPTVIESCPAQLEQVLHFEFGNSFDLWYADGRHLVSERINVVSCHTSFAAFAELKGGVESFAIFFHPTGFWRLFGVPVSELTNRGGIEGTSVLGSPVRDLWNDLGEAARFPDRVQVAEKFLLRRLAHTAKTTQITVAAEFLFRAHGSISVSALADLAGMRRRHFERRFREDFAMPPKVFARVARFQAAVDKKLADPGRSWLQIAHEFGYHDQMHMIHDFEKLGGDAPTKFLAQLGNMRFADLDSLP